MIRTPLSLLSSETVIKTISVVTQVADIWNTLDIWKLLIAQYNVCLSEKRDHWPRTGFLGYIFESSLQMIIV